MLISSGWMKFITYCLELLDSVNYYEVLFIYFWRRYEGFLRRFQTCNRYIAILASSGPCWGSGLRRPSAPPLRDAQHAQVAYKEPCCGQTYYCAHLTARGSSRWLGGNPRDAAECST